MKLLDFIKEKFRGNPALKQTMKFRELAEIKNNGASNTFVSAKERDRRKKRKKIAKKSRGRNRNKK